MFWKSGLRLTPASLFIVNYSNVFSILPLVFYLLPNISLPVEIRVPFLAPLASGADGVSFSGILSRLIILLPATWLAAFNSRRHRKLFQLRERYAHRAALAQSIEGFKQEAPDYEQEMAAAVFWDLTQRSEKGGRDPSDASDVPNPILRWLLGQLEGRTKND